MRCRAAPSAVRPPVTAPPDTREWTAGQQVIVRTLVSRDQSSRFNRLTTRFDQHGVIRLQGEQQPVGTAGGGDAVSLASAARWRGIFSTARPAHLPNRILQVASVAGGVWANASCSARTPSRVTAARAPKPQPVRGASATDRSPAGKVLVAVITAHCSPHTPCADRAASYVSSIHPVAHGVCGLLTPKKERAAPQRRARVRSLPGSKHWASFSGRPRHTSRDRPKTPSTYILPRAAILSSGIGIIIPIPH